MELCSESYISQLLSIPWFCFCRQYNHADDDDDDADEDDVDNIPLARLSTLGLSAMRFDEFLNYEDKAHTSADTINNVITNNNTKTHNGKISDEDNGNNDDEPMTQLTTHEEA